MSIGICSKICILFFLSAHFDLFSDWSRWSKLSCQPDWGILSYESQPTRFWGGVLCCSWWGGWKWGVDTLWVYSRLWCQRVKDRPSSPYLWFYHLNYNPNIIKIWLLYFFKVKQLGLNFWCTIIVIVWHCSDDMFIDHS